MTALRCALVDLGAAPEVAAVATALLDAQPDLRLTPAPQADTDALIALAVGLPHAQATVALAALRARWPACVLLVVCEEIDAEQMQSWLVLGVADLVTARGTRCELVARLRRALGSYRTPPTARVEAGTAALRVDPRLRGFIGAAPGFVQQVARLPAVAACDAGVLILGETGTGKEVFARAVHYLSPRAARPWVALNCGAIPTELIESELFGHVRGAYTAAHAGREGLVREAEGGTLFLDDVDCLPLVAQTKLLRFLQEKEYRQVGANRLHKADVRVIAASNRGLQEMAAQGQFRLDLFYRLNVLNLTLPPLRERRGDVPALALHFARKCAQGAGRAEVALTPAALRRLAAHDWPGNVRELEHVIDRAVLLATGVVVGAEDLGLGDSVPPPVGDDSFRAAKARLVADFERGYVERLLHAHRGNVSQAASAARKNRRAFFELMRKHQIEPDRFRGAL
jgi:two-component system response regulator GlrR